MNETFTQRHATKRSCIKRIFLVFVEGDFATSPASTAGTGNT